MKLLRSPFLQQSLEYLQSQYSPATAAAYVGWIRRYIQYHRFQAAADMLHDKDTLIHHYLIHLATAQQTSARTQNQARAALLILYREILRTAVEHHIPQAKTAKNLPIILTKTEVHGLLEMMRGATKLMAQVLYGSGLKVGECVALRIAAIDIATRMIR